MIVITGASDGLGLELAKLYKTVGKTVVNVSRRDCAYAEHNFLHDLSEGDGIVAAAKEVLALDEPLEALINNAGVLTVEPVDGVSEAEIERTMGINVKAPMLLVSELMDRIKHDGTDIVNVSTAMATKQRVDHTVYLASKWALRGFSLNLQGELAKFPSRVISFCPGAFDTDIFKKLGQEDNSAVKGKVMSVEAMAICLKQLLDLPKNMEVSEIVINRKKA